MTSRHSLRVSFGAAVITMTAMSVALAEPRTATPPASIKVPPGFRVELLRSAQDGEDSWISMSFDPRGLIVVGLDARGVLCAHDAIYVAATDSKEFWRFRDTAGDDRFADRTLLQSFDYRSRYGHGQNQIVLGPDDMLYLVIGNDVSFPRDASPASPYRDPRPDRLLPDPHDAGQDDRVGAIVRTDGEGRDWTVLAGGFRNPFDAAFSPEGELFTWDADMEWDVGQPWYRPTRLNHVVSGGEYGWRWGTAKWPPSYPDSLPPNLETGLGSPTALVFGTRSRFPEAFRTSLFMADWQHGRILSVTLVPDGASFTATDTVFAEGAPLNVCDMEFGPDGAIYFITGGRGSQSGLYRIVAEASDAGPMPTSAPRDRTAALARARRHALERYHAGPMPGAVDDLWPELGAPDRWLRHAARVALERQPLADWRERASTEKDTLRRGEALLAWVRVSSADERVDVVRAVLAGETGGDEQVVLATLRVLSIALARGVDLGSDAPRVHDMLERLDSHPSEAVQRELVELRIATRAPGAVMHVLRRLDLAAGQEEQIHCLHALIRWDGAWELPARRRVIEWFLESRSFTGGHVLPKIMRRMQDDFVASLSTEERTYLATEIAQRTGHSAQVSSGEIVVELDALRGTTERIARSEIEASHPSLVSPMPQGLLDTLTLEEVLDLLAVVRAGVVPTDK